MYYGSMIDMEINHSNKICKEVHPNKTHEEWVKGELKEKLPRTPYDRADWL